MKRKLALTVLFVLVTLLGATVTVVANGEVDHIFDAERIMHFDEGTRFENGFVNGGIINPGLGTYSTYQGIKFEKSEYLGEDAVKVELLDGKTTGYFDFNYYQWDADAKKPALDASKYHYFKIKLAYDNPTKLDPYLEFWASKETALNSTVGAASKTIAYTLNSDGWTELVFRVDDLVFADDSAWLNSTVRQFRVYIFNGYRSPSSVCYVAGFGLFETEEEACGYNFETKKFRDVVSYNANGGVYAPQMQVKEKGKALKLTEDIPGRGGHVFLGWSTKPNGTVKYKPGDYYRGEKGAVLYAIWKADYRAPEGEHIFDADRIMHVDSEFGFKNNFINGGVLDPVNNSYWTNTGIKYSKTTYKKEAAVKIKLLNGATTGYLGFNYFFYNTREYEPSLYGGKYRYVKIRYAYDDASQVNTLQFVAFKATEEAGTYASLSKTVDIENGFGEWQEAVIDLSQLKYSDKTGWTESLTHAFRFKLFESNTNTNATCYIAGIGFFETEEQARTYNFANGTYGSCIEYDANGGIAAPKPQIKRDNMPLTLTESIPSRPGYKFAGWSESPDGEVRYPSGAIYIADKSVKLYAVWEKDTSGEYLMGEHIFAGDRLGEYDEGTCFHNGFVDGDEINPFTEDYSKYVGITHNMVTYKGEKALQLMLLDGYVTGYLDFNYYQWNSDSYEPSLDSTKYRYLRIRYAMVNWIGSGRTKTMRFWASKDAPVLGTLIDPGQKTWSITLSSGWTDTVIDLKTLKFGDDTFWGDSTVRQFRIYPFEGNQREGALVYISGIGFFETREEAQSYDFATGTFKSTAVDVEVASEIEVESQTTYNETEKLEEVIAGETETEKEVVSEEKTEGATVETELESETEMSEDTELKTDQASEEETETKLELKQEPEEEKSILKELIEGNQIAIGIVIGCIIGVIITVIVVAVVVNDPLKKRY